MRFLILEHYFAQDIDALRRAAGEEIEMDTIPYDLLRSEALRIFPEDVGTGLEAFTRPELEQARRRYAAILREILEDRFIRRPFDAVIAPSDTFFYVRSMPVAAHALGVPFLVVQKETTISEHTMHKHAEDLRRFSPPLADLTTVCSERHKRFLERAGAARDSILVTGQPRFDFYKYPPMLPVEAQAGQGARTLLFLSYAVDAYYPGDGTGDGEGGEGWSSLHAQTEQGLYELARRGWRVLVKPHPQQSLDAIEEWRRRAGELWEKQVFLVDPQADVRPLIVTADVIVGFQSTALLEAMLAGRPVLYTGWDSEAKALGGQLIPFERWEREITVVRRPGDLPDAVVSAAGGVCSGEVSRRRRRAAESYLGPLDGLAAARTLRALRAEAARWAERRGGPERELRARLERRRAPLRLARQSRAWSRAARRRVGKALGR